MRGWERRRGAGSGLEGAGEAEQIGGKAVQVGPGKRGRKAGMGCEGAEGVAFGAAADGAGPMGTGGRLVGARPGIGLGGRAAGSEGGGFLFQGFEGGGRLTGRVSVGAGVGLSWARAGVAASSVVNSRAIRFIGYSHGSMSGHDAPAPLQAG